MADKKVSMLPRVDAVNPEALLVCEQDGQVMAILGQVLINMLLTFADGHGGISTWDIVPGPGPLDFTLKLILAKSGSVIEVPLHNGKGIASITRLRSEGSEETGIVDVYQVLYNDTTTQELRLRNGKTGATGAQTYVHIKYASVDPARPPHSMGDIPDSWEGIYVGLEAEPPKLWSEYKWFKRKGEKGDTGDPATLLNATTEYQVGTSGTVMPSGEWLQEIPYTPQGRWLWTRTTHHFNSGDPVVTYGVSYIGRDGKGNVKSVCSVEADEAGDVDLYHFLNDRDRSRNDPVVVKKLIITPDSFKEYIPAGDEETGLHNDLGYKQKAMVPVQGVLESMTPYVTFSLPSLEKAAVGIANQIACYDGGIILYADGVPSAEITALTVECRKAVI